MAAMALSLGLTGCTVTHGSMNTVREPLIRDRSINATICILAYCNVIIRSGDSGGEGDGQEINSKNDPR